MSDDLIPMDPEEGIDRFLAHRKPSVRKSTYQNAKTRLRHFLDWCEEHEIENLNDLNGRHLADFVTWRQPDIAPITLQKQLSSVRQALRYWANIEAVEDGLAEKLHAPELPDGSKSKDVKLGTDRATAILAALDRYHYASREHVIMGLLWRTGMRRGALQALDVEDFDADDHVLELRHRPEEGTALKNGEDGERDVYLGPTWSAILEDYIRQNRDDATDEYGRRPLITTRYGRASKGTIYGTVHRMTQPCRWGECPHDREPESCEAIGDAGMPQKCPSSRSPHAIRRGRITHELNNKTPPEALSERADVSLDVLYDHYDARTSREKMDVRREHFEEDS